MLRCRPLALNVYYALIIIISQYFQFITIHESQSKHIKSCDQHTLLSEIYIGGAPICIEREREREKGRGRERISMLITISG